MPIVTAPDPKHWPLTEDALIERGEQPLYRGDFVSFRFQYLDSAGVAVRLDIPSAAVISMTITGPTGLTLTRDTATDLAGVAPTQKQIVIDANQATGDATTSTGKGWYEVFFSASDMVALAAVVGRGAYKIVVNLNSRPLRHLAGPIDVVD